MEIYECTHKVKCDFAGCKNIAAYTLVKGGVIKRDFCFCKDCMNEMYACIARILVPKAVTSPFKLNKRLRKDEK